MIDFPNSPTLNQIFTAVGASWQWDGTKWVPYGAGALPSGVMMAFGGAAAPTGWLLCNGALVSRTIYAALFAVIGTSYGVGDGSTTFGLPDLRGRVAAGMDPSNATGRLTASATGGVSAAALGNNGGEQAHTLATPEIPSHNHTLTDPQHNHLTNEPTHLHGSYLARTDYTVQFVVGGGNWAAQNMGNTDTNVTGLTVLNHATGITIAAAGGGGGHNTVQPALIVNWIIKM